MSCCEKCWSDAYIRSRLTGRPQADCYRDLLEERKESPCSPEEQAGLFWNCRTRFEDEDEKD